MSEFISDKRSWCENYENRINFLKKKKKNDGRSKIEDVNFYSRCQYKKNYSTQTDKCSIQKPTY